MAAQTELRQTLKDVDDSRGFLGASRGSQAAEVTTAKADSSLSGLVGSVGDLFSLAVATGDQYVKTKIDETVRPATDQVFDEFGVNDVANINEDITAEPRPKDIDKSMKNIERLTQAKDQGVTSDTSYWGRMESISRQLRARYPGHRDYIDQRISSIAGGKPANEIVRDLLAKSQSSAANASKEANQLMELRESLNREGLWNPEYKNLDRQQLIDVTSAQFRRRQQLKWDKENIDYAKAAGENTDRLVARSADKAAFAFQAKVFQDTSVGIGKSKEEFDQALKTFTTSPNPTAEETTALRAKFSLYKQEYMDGLNRTLLDYGPDLPKKEFDDIVARHTATLNAYQDALTNKDVGMLTLLANKVETFKSGDDEKFLNYDATFRLTAAARRNAGDASAELIIQNSEGLKSKRDKQLASDGLLKVFGGEANAVDEMAKAKEADNPSAYARGVLKTHITALSDPKATPEQKANIIKSFSRPGLLDIFTENKDLAYTSVVNGNVYAEVKKSGDPGAQEQYTSFAETTYVAQNKTHADTLNQLSKSKNVIIQVNPLNQRIEVTLPAMKTARGQPLTKTWNSRTNRYEMVGSGLDADYNKAQDAASALNNSMEGFKPILKDQGIEPIEFWDANYGLGQFVVGGKSNLGGPKEGQSKTYEFATGPISVPDSGYEFTDNVFTFFQDTPMVSPDLVKKNNLDSKTPEELQMMGIKRTGQSDGPLD
jgi:hypothetical protein